MMKKDLPKPKTLLALAATADRLCARAKISSTKDSHKVAMDACDAVGKAAIKLGFDDYGDVYKGKAHDQWVLRKGFK